ncbi:hypothetical protein A2U01_0079704, partial [Trifolium medium]|nr:hypothetical protein [Trifolium medium]
ESCLALGLSFRLWPMRTTFMLRRMGGVTPKPVI